MDLLLHMMAERRRDLTSGRNKIKGTSGTAVPPHFVEGGTYRRFALKEGSKGILRSAAVTRGANIHPLAQAGEYTWNNRRLFSHRFLYATLLGAKIKEGS